MELYQHNADLVMMWGLFAVSGHMDYFIYSCISDEI